MPITFTRSAFALQELLEPITGRILKFLQIKNELSRGKFGYHIGAPEAYIFQNSEEFRDKPDGTSTGT